MLLAQHSCYDVDIQAQSLAPAARQATTVTRADKRKLTDTMFAATQDDSVIDLCNDDDPVDLDICASNLAHGQLSGSSASGVRNRRKSKSQAGSNGQHHSHTAERTRVILPPATQASIAAVHRPSVGKLTHNTYTVQQIQQNVFLPSTKQQTKGRRRLLVQGQPHANNAGSEEVGCRTSHLCLLTHMFRA